MTITRSIPLALERLLSNGAKNEDDIQKTRLIRQVNGLNIFYTAVAGSVSVIFILINTSIELALLQVVATFLYINNIILVSNGKLKAAQNLTIFIFELHLFGVMLLTNAWHSPAVTIVILYPLLAALVEVPIMQHLAVSIMQAGALYFMHLSMPGVESYLVARSGINALANQVLQIMAVTYTPAMAAVIMAIIFNENMLARAKQKEMLVEISSANKKLKLYAGQLQDEAQKLRVELNVAKKIQTMVLPTEEELSKIKELEISCMMRTATEVGGDYYDVVKIGDRITVGMGDVTGHGLSSGIIMLMAQTAIRTMAEMGLENPSDWLPVINRVMYSNINRIKENRSMTLLLLNYEKGRCKVSGQHESVIICRKNGDISIIDTVDNGFYIGMVPETGTEFKTEEFELKQGDLLFLYSDGVTEAENGEKRQFGLDNLCDTVKKYHDLASGQIINKFMKDLYNFVGESDIYDDISIMAIKQS
jgi:serine phosphatase RsbU (regulator of sigma subunit)